MGAPKQQKSIEDSRRFVSMVAAKQGWGVCPDPEHLQILVEGLTENYNRHGYFLCPCRDGTGEREKDADIVCPCVYNVPDQQEYGQCFCGLFVTKEFEAEGREPRQIPERRPEELQP